MPYAAAAAGPTPIPGYVSSGPSVGSLRDQLQLGPAALTDASSVLSGTATSTHLGGATAASAIASSGGGAGSSESLPLAIVTTAGVAVVSTTSGVITHLLSAHQLENRTVTVAKVMVVETATRSYGQPWASPLLPELTAEVILGCSDGAVVIWTVASAKPSEALVKEARSSQPAGLLRIIKTPHSSAITTLTLATFVNTTSYKSTPAATDLIETPEMSPGSGAEVDASFNNRRRKTFASLVVGTKGGSLTHFTVYGAPEGFPDAIPENSNTEDTRLIKLHALPVHVFTMKKVHSSIIDVQVNCLSPSMQYSASSKTYVNDSNTEVELVTNCCSSKIVYALGPAHVSLHHGRQGTELRRLGFSGTMIPTAVRALVVNRFFTGFICEGDDHFVASLDCTAESIRHWVRLSSAIPVSTAAERTERLERGFPNQATYSMPSLLAPSLAPSASGSPNGGGSSDEVATNAEKYSPSDAKMTCYGCEVDGLHPDGRLAVLTNEGCVVLEAEMASLVVAERGIPQSQLAFALPPRTAFNRSVNGSFADRGSVRGAGKRSSASGSARDPVSKEGAGQAETTSTAHLLVCTGRGRVSGVELTDSLVSSVTRPRSCTHYVLRALHELSVGVHDASADSMPPTVAPPSSRRSGGANKAGAAAAGGASAAGVTAEVSQRTLLEPTPMFRVNSVHVSVGGEVACVITDTLEILVFELGSVMAPLILPPSLKQRQPDTAAWSLGGLHLALLNLQTQRITVATLECRSGRYCFSPAAPHEVATSNIPTGISGGKWLCVHYAPTFSGVSSQFYRWESAVRGGGGALGGFIPQPRIVLWDNSATLCALGYATQVVFMHAHRKLFSMLCSTDLRSQPQHIYFTKRVLIVVLQREIALMFPTSTGVHTIIVASSSAASPVDGAGLAHSPSPGCFDTIVHLRPPGTLTVASFDEQRFDLYLCDEALRISRVPLAGSIAHLLWTLHAAPSAGSDAAWAAAQKMLTAFLTQHVASNTSRLTIEAVECFANACGCAELLAHCKGIDVLTGQPTVAANNGVPTALGASLNSPMSPSKNQGGASASASRQADPIATAAIASVAPYLDAALVSVKVISSDLGRSVAERWQQIAPLRDVIREQLVAGALSSTAAGWATSDGALPERLAEVLLARADRLTREVEHGVADAAWWQRTFLCDLAHDLLMRRYD